MGHHKNGSLFRSKFFPPRNVSEDVFDGTSGGPVILMAGHTFRGST